MAGVVIAASFLESNPLSFLAAVPNGPSWYTAAPAGENVNEPNTLLRVGNQGLLSEALPRRWKVAFVL